jgi:hypothetical protein
VGGTAAPHSEAPSGGSAIILRLGFSRPVSNPSVTVNDINRADTIDAGWNDYVVVDSPTADPR